MVASLDCPQNSPSARLRGSKNPTAGLRFLARVSKSLGVSPPTASVAIVARAIYKLILKDH